MAVAAALWPWRLDLAGGYYEEMHYRLRTLLFLMAVLPPLLAVVWLWVLPLKPHTYGDAVLIGSLDAMAVLLALLFLQWGWTAVISQLPNVGGK